MTGRSPSDPWQFLKQGVSLRTALLAFVPIGLWIVFIVVFVYTYRAIIHLAGPAGTVLLVLRSLIELASATVAFKYFFDILARGVERERTGDSQHDA